MIIKRVRNYINDPEYKISILKNKIDIENYIKLGIIGDKEIEVIGSYKTIIKGNNLTITRLLDSEILIQGDINSIELR